MQEFREWRESREWLELRGSRKAHWSWETRHPQHAEEIFKGDTGSANCPASLTRQPQIVGGSCKSNFIMGGNR